MGEVCKFGLTKQSVFTKGCGPNEELDYKLGIGSMPIVQLRYLLKGLGQDRRGFVTRWEGVRLKIGGEGRGLT